MKKVTEEQLDAVSNNIVRALLQRWEVPLTDSTGTYLIPGHASGAVYNIISDWLETLK